MHDPAPAMKAGVPAAPWLWKALLAAAWMSAVVAAWHGGAVGSALVAALTAGTWLARPRAAALAASANPAAEDCEVAANPVGGRIGAEVMVSQVVPVWSRQMEVTRDVAAEGLALLLDNFSQISGALGDLANQLEGFSPAAAPGAVDEAIDQQSPALQALLAPSQRAFAQRDEFVSVLARCADALAELQLQAKNADEISRHTRLVAFNASIEANRNQAGVSGSQAVANELRDLASRMAATGEAVHRLVAQLSQAVNGARRAGEIDDTGPDELQLELRIRAREALAAMLGAVGTSLAGTRAMKESSDALRNQLDEAFVNFQFGDRVSQMLSIVGNDMSNFAQWVARNPRASQSDASDWLQALDSSYTMEEQRSHHHGNVHVDRGSEVEFF